VRWQAPAERARGRRWERTHRHGLAVPGSLLLVPAAVAAFPLLLLLVLLLSILWGVTPHACRVARLRGRSVGRPRRASGSNAPVLCAWCEAASTAASASSACAAGDAAWAAGRPLLAAGAGAAAAALVRAHAQQLQGLYRVMT
jgi:hypothetical protein